MMELSRKKKLLTEYDRMARAVRMTLLDHYQYQSKLVWNVIAEARYNFAALIPQIPYIGEKNIWQFNLDTCVMNLALFNTLKKFGATLPESVQMIHDIFEAYLLSLSKPLRWAYRCYYFSPIQQYQLRNAAKLSQLRRFPEDWVFSYIERDGISFDFGIDIIECAILKFYKIHRVAEFVPYLCKLDHASGKILGLGLSRRGTLAEGEPVCDCRWKRGIETLGWSTRIITS